MLHVRSSDGTRIGCEPTGVGPAVLLVHGTGSDRTRWGRTAPLLAGHRVYAMDRRGRGLSGDAPEYALAREAEDVASIVEALGGPVAVVAHSHGAVCALEAARLTDRVARLVLYEPPIPLDPAAPPPLLTALEELLASGDRAGVVELFLRAIVGMSDTQLAVMRALPMWPARVDAAHTIVREMRASSAYVLAAERLATVRAPTLLLAGANSPPWMLASTERLAAALPDARRAVMPGVGHDAIDVDPARFVSEVRAFLDPWAEAARA